MPYIGTIVTWSADTLTIAGFLGAVAIGTISGVYLFRMQRRCIRGMRDEIRGVRIVHDACDEQ